MSKQDLSDKGKRLIQMYEQMAQTGYDRRDGIRVDNAFSDFELRPYRSQLRQIFQDYSVQTVLDYGSGGSDWEASDFDASGQSATEYFSLQKLCRYEPARDLDERQNVDCVVSFDVLEHIFISDIPLVLRDLFSWAGKLLVLNVACYPAAAKLPNGENAHITVRTADWWKGMVDGVAIEYPDTSIFLICSTGWRKSNAVPIWKAATWQENDTFVINQ